MAARFAVTTGNWTGAIWAATAGGAAGSAAVPTNADDVTINKNVTVTINDTTAVANSISCAIGTTSTDVGGILTCTTAANWKITLQNGMTGTATTNPSNTATYAGSVNFDMSGSAYSGEVVLNNANSTTDGTGIFKLYGNYTIKGAARKRHTTINSALTANSTKSVVVADATGWTVGDRLVFATTSAYNATPRTDIVTIDTITAGSGTTATVTWIDGTGTGGAVLYDHASGCPVGNFNSNLKFYPATDYYRACISVEADTNQQSTDSTVRDVLFSKMRNSGYSRSPFNYQTARSSRHKGIHSCAFYQCEGASYGQIWLQYLSANEARTWNIFYTDRSASPVLSANDQSFIYNYGPDEDYAVFRATKGIQVGAPGQTQRRHKISGLAGADGVTSSAALLVQVANDIIDCDIWSNYVPGVLAYAPCELNGCSFDSAVFANATTVDSQIRAQSGAVVTAIDCGFPTSETIAGISSSLPVSVLLNNRDGDATVQEFYQYQSTTVPAIQRSTATVSRSTSSMEFTLNSTTAQPYTFEVLAKAGETIKLMVYVQIGSTYDDAAYTYPSITVSGLGITPVSVSATAASVGAWELRTIDATNSGAADGNLTVTLSAQSATANAKAYFSGLPASPFVSRCRHYGYLFNETSPTREVNPTIDTGISEATAIGYGNSGTDLEVTWGVSSTLAVKVSSTFKKVYHFTQADGCLNVGSAMPLTGAGLDDSPALFAAGNVTISDGAVLNGSGSISMDTFTLSTEFAGGVNYTYTGGTFSQATTVPTFSGGTLNIGAAGTFTYTQAASMTVSATPTSASNYVLSSGTFTGILNFQNTTAYNITVEIPAGVTANSTGSPGAGTVTFVSPQVYQSVVITGFTAGSRIYIYDTEGAGELLFNGTASAGETVISGSTCTWTDATAAAANRVIFLRVAYVNGATAKEFIEVANIGTCGTTDGTKTVSYIVAQTADAVYDANAVTMDGTIFAACGITFTDAATDLVNINIAADTVALKTIYAAFAWWIFTSPGIDDDVAYIRAIDPANYELTSMKFRNTSTDPLKITDGYFYDSTGSVENCVDITSPGNIYPMPAHVVPYQTTGTYAITGDLQDALDAIAGVPADVLSAAQTTPIHSDVRKVVGITVDGTGTEGDPWGPA